MNIFDNDAEVLQIGALTIENQTDCVVISGDVQIAKDKVGQEQAKALLDFAKRLCARFEEFDELPDEQVLSIKPSTQVANPFE